MTRRKGFTLIELLVVIAIIALLMSILMPALSRVKKQAQSVVCMSRLRDWGMLFKLYVDDNNGFFIEGWAFTQHSQNRGPDEYGLWMNSMRPYYKDEWDMLLCPTATRMVEGDLDWGTFKAWYRDIANRYPGPGEGTTRRFVGSYSTNDWISYSPQGRGAGRPPVNFWKSTQNVTNAEQVPLIGDNTWHDAWPQHTDAPVAMPFDYGWGNKGTAGEMNQFCIDRHHGTSNLAFADWSVRRVGLKELWALKWHHEYPVNGPWTKLGGVQPTDWPQWLRKYRDY
jgi:prepilin-type N-terminal cleavage/methylation domain-containing protein